MPALSDIALDQLFREARTHRWWEDRPIPEAVLSEIAELAKADGRWEAAYASPSTVELPPDLQRALDASPQAAEFWAGLNKANRYAIVYQLEDAKKPETRERRLAKFMAMLERGEKLY